MSINNNKYLYLIIILFGFFLSVATSSYYVSKYDKYTKNGYDHQLIKDETYYHWRQGDKIAKEVRAGKNFFLSGDISFTKPLHQRIVALYSLITGYDLTTEKNDYQEAQVNLGGKLPFLIFQSFIYFFSLFYFSKKIRKIFPDKSFIYIILFLSLEFTIFQYHSSFWTESIYFSFLLIIFAMVLEKKNFLIHNLFIGILVGLAFLQRSGAIFYIFPILICYSFLFKRFFLKPFLGIIIGYSLISILMGIFNYYKTNVFYIYPSEGKYSIHTYFSTDIIAKKYDLSFEEAKIYEVEKAIEWAEKNKIIFNDQFDLNKIKSTLELIPYFINEVDKNKFFNYVNHRQFQILLNNPILTFKKVLKNTIHFVVLNPTFNHFYNEHRGKNESRKSFINTDTHKKLIPYRIVYSLVIYFFSILGFYYLFKRKKFFELSLITLSILYYVGLFGWYGKTRLYVPSLIYLSVFFGIGLNVFIDYLRNFKKSF